ncbi:hypothetical protein JCGZ_19437 [Jatropha curcas]|uniref:Transcription repressor n=1 Tax=Jatropha curcas TaxID=180498 RepID=A0A067JZI7_JATCU|nr:transcription repressor OFP13 [Jatropha curcas]KDP29272.1 hypothetical protein JCGZ_19437 [Jatropha curcas]
MKIPSIFKNKETKWASCNNPKTRSFRDDVFKTVNSVFFDSVVDGVETSELWFTNSSETSSFSTESDEFDGESLEMVVRGVTSDRLFFEPGDTNSILEEAKPFKESVVLALESENPYVDFRRSMEEMVESHGLKDWDCLEELLRWYLKVNGKKNHGFIVGAFIDLLVQINIDAADASYSTNSTSFSSAVSTFSSSSPFPSPLCTFQQGIHEIEEQDKMVFS